MPVLGLLACQRLPINQLMYHASTLTPALHWRAVRHALHDEFKPQKWTSFSIESGPVVLYVNRRSLRMYLFSVSVKWSPNVASPGSSTVPVLNLLIIILRCQIRSRSRLDKLEGRRRGQGPLVTDRLLTYVQEPSCTIGYLESSQCNCESLKVQKFYELQSLAHVQEGPWHMKRGIRASTNEEKRAVLTIPQSSVRTKCNFDCQLRSRRRRTLVQRWHSKDSSRKTSANEKRVFWRSDQAM